MKNQVVHTLSDLLEGNKKIYQVNCLVTDKLSERIHSRYKWFDDFEDSKILSASSYQVTQFKIRVCDIKNVSEIRG